MKKRKGGFTLFMFIFIGLGLFGYLGYRIYGDFFVDNSVHKQIDSIDFYGYSLKQSDTEIYKTTFKELTNILNDKPINYEEYAKCISKLFIIDLYTLDNKLGSTDIGGLQYLYKDLKDNFKENMGATIYRTVQSNLNGDRKQELPTVKEVTVEDITETKYTYNETEYNGYLVTLKWTYEKDLGYQNNMKLTIINNKDILYIVKGE